MKKLQLHDFLKFEAFSQLKASPNKKNFAFVKSSQNEKENQVDRVIYLSDGTEFKQLTSLKKEANFIWEDDQHLLFTTKRFKHEEEQADTSFIYRIAIDGGEAQQAYSLPLSINSMWVLNEQQLLISADFDVDHPNYYSYDEEKREKHLKEKKENDFAIELHQIPFWFNGTQYIDKQRTRLFLFDKTTQTLEPITKPSLDVANATVSHDKSQVYFTASSFITRAPLKEKLYVYDVKTGTTTNLITTNQYSIYEIVPLASDLYLFMSNQKKLGLNQNPGLYKLNGKNDLELIKDDIDLGNSIGSDVRYGGNASILKDEQTFIYNTTVDGHSELIEFNGTKHQVIFKHEGSVDGFTKINNKLIVMGLFNQQLQEFYDQNLTALTHFNTALDQITLPKPEKLTFKSHQAELSGWVLMPEGKHKDKSLKAILDIHGGPKTAYGEVYYHEMAYWHSLGYVVMFCNPHGSSGRGDAFSDIRGKYGTIDYEDIMNFVDEVLKKYPAINPEKIGVTGGSYGGFMTNWIIGHTNRFKCAITQRSISNWLSFQGVSDIGYYFAEDQNDATLYSEKGQQKLWWHSPLRYASNFSTPTLVIHSTDDYRCPIDQGYQLFTALIDRQVEAKMLILKGENHDLSRSGKPKARIKRLTEMTNWFNKYLADE